jgi:Holliday junction DNA helicase RuvA
MIGYLCGKVLDFSEKKILVLTSGGVGYEVFPAGSLLSLVKKNAEIEFETTTIVRETEISIYGFGDTSEKNLFLKLLSVSGIGPKMALTIVSTPVANFLDAVGNGEIDILTKIPGLGKKTAERLVIELRGKLDFSAGKNIPQNKSFEEAKDALKNLGYDDGTISEILKSAEKESSAEDLVKYFLRSNA